MALSDRQLLAALSRTPFVDSAELALILGEPHATVHRALADLLADGITGRVSHGTAHLASSQRYHLTANAIRETAGFLGFETPSDFVRAYPMSREWLTLLIRRMDTVAAVYRLAASISPGIDGLRSQVEFHRRGRFDTTITLHDGRSFGVVRQGLALRRRSLYDRLRAIAQYSHGRRPGTVLILVPSAWELRRTARFCDDRNIDDCYVTVESRATLERRDRRLWCCTSWVIGSPYSSLEPVVSRNSPGGGPRAQSSERKGGLDTQSCTHGAGCAGPGDAAAGRWSVTPARCGNLAAYPQGRTLRRRWTQIADGGYYWHATPWPPNDVLET